MQLANRIGRGLLLAFLLLLARARRLHIARRSAQQRPARADAAREQQLRRRLLLQLDDIAAVNEGRPGVLGGTFNVEPANTATLPSTVIVPFKKARIMQHWARRVGAKLQCQTK